MILVKSFKQPFRLQITLFFLCLIQLGCATYQTKVARARNLMETRQSTVSVAELKPLAKAEGRDQLVYLLDYATALQEARQYRESAQAFIQADQMSEVKDYHSITKNAASLLLSEELVQYKGDDYEKLMINAMNAINFLMLDEPDSALVEVRRLNEKLYLYRERAKRDWKPSSFATYLSAMIWESQKKWDDAYIDYQKTWEIDPSIPFLKEDLLRSSVKAQRWSSYKKWLKEFEAKDRVAAEWNHKKYGELVLIYQQGWGPQKAPSHANHRFPTLRPVPSYITSVQLTAEIEPRASKEEGLFTQKSQPIYNVEEMAVKALKDQYAALVAKRVAGIVAKEVAADQVRQKNELLGGLLALGLHLSDRADLRQWSTLPKTLQLVRMPLKPGQYKVSAKGLNQEGLEAGANMPEQMVNIVAGQKKFLLWRTFK